MLDIRGRHTYAIFFFNIWYGNPALPPYFSLYRVGQKAKKKKKRGKGRKKRPELTNRFKSAKAVSTPPFPPFPAEKF